MSTDDVVTALDKLADAIRRSSAADQDRHEELMQVIKAQANHLNGIESDTRNLAMIEQTLRDCEMHLRNLAERLAPAPDDD